MPRRGSLGLDIGTQTVHVAQVTTPRGQPTVVNFGGVELPPGAVREGEILDLDTSVQAVRELMGSAGIKDKSVTLGVANQRVVVRQIDLPWQPESELRESLRFQVADHIPIPVDDAEIDFHVVEDYQLEDGARMLRILLVAAHRDMVATHVEVATKAGLKPVGIDLNPFAVLRAMGDTHSDEPASEVLVDVGAGITNILVHRNGVPSFVRILVMGGSDITESVVSAAGGSFEDAEAAKRATRLGAPGGDRAVAQAVAERAGAFVDEVKSSLDYFQSQTGGIRLSRVTLTGGGALLGGLAERLASTLRLPTEVGNPFDRWPVKGTVYGPDELAQVGPTLATAVGLALGGAR